MSIQTEEEAKDRRKYNVILSEKMVQGPSKQSIQSSFRRQNLQYVNRIEIFMAFEIRRFLRLYGVSRPFSIASKESQDLSNAPRALIDTLTSLLIIIMKLSNH